MHACKHNTRKHIVYSLGADTNTPRTERDDIVQRPRKGIGSGVHSFAISESASLDDWGLALASICPDHGIHADVASGTVQMG